MRSDRYKQDDMNTAGAQESSKSAAMSQKSPKSAKKRKKGRRTLLLLLLLILLLAAAIAAAVTYSYKSAENSLAVEFTEDSPELKIGDTYKSMDYVKSSIGDVTAEAEYLDAETIGDKEMKYTVARSLYGGLLEVSKTFTLPYSVIDDIKPLMLWSGDRTILARDTEFDIQNVIAYGDNADPEPEVTYDGDVDMSKEGNYPLHVTVTDASGNSIDWGLTVTVAESIPIPESDPTRIKFSDFVSKYKADGRSFGIDVSSWQGNVDFGKVKAAGCDFVIVRIGYTDEGDLILDDYFEQNLKNAKAAGHKVGLYMYSYDSTEDEVRGAAEQIIDKLGGETLDLPIAFDWEDFGSFQTYKMSFRTLNKLYDVFDEVLSGAGYDCMLYGSLNPLEKIWEDTDTRPVWLAHYADKTTYSGPYMLWQVSSIGKIDGISGPVDLDILYEK